MVPHKTDSKMNPIKYDAYLAFKKTVATNTSRRRTKEL